MSRVFIRLGIVLVSRKPVSRWATRGFVPEAVLAEVPATAPGTRLDPPGDVERWYAGARELEFYPGETGHYRDNLAFARPSLWVALRLPATEPVAVAMTANPYEGEGLAGDDGLVVEAVPMPGAVQAFVAAYVAEHHVEQPFVKRQRKRADPEALAHRGPIGRAGKWRAP